MLSCRMDSDDVWGMGSLGVCRCAAATVAAATATEAAAAKCCIFNWHTAYVTGFHNIQLEIEIEIEKLVTNLLHISTKQLCWKLRLRAVAFCGCIYLFTWQTPLAFSFSLSRSLALLLLLAADCTTMQRWWWCATTSAALQSIDARARGSVWVCWLVAEVLIGAPRMMWPRMH